MVVQVVVNLSDQQMPEIVLQINRDQLRMFLQLTGDADPRRHNLRELGKLQDVLAKLVSVCK